MEFRRVETSESAYDAYTALFATCFPGGSRFTRAYLDWLYRANPDGKVVGFDAWEGDRLAAHYVCIPARVSAGGADVAALLSLNTATHPDFQGRGLFTTLAELTYRAGADEGFDCVYGVANANSTPGFVRKLRFQHLGPLDAKIGMGPLGIDLGDPAQAQFRRLWSPDALAWRSANPINKLTLHPAPDRARLLAPALLGGMCAAVAEIPMSAPSQLPTGGRPQLLRLMIGRTPTGWGGSPLYRDIPARLRPSPLNLIYRSLSRRVDTIEPDRIFFTFLDFDAY